MYYPTLSPFKSRAVYVSRPFFKLLSAVPYAMHVLQVHGEDWHAAMFSSFFICQVERSVVLRFFSSTFILPHQLTSLLKLSQCDILDQCFSQFQSDAVDSWIMWSSVFVLHFFCIICSKFVQFFKM